MEIILYKNNSDKRTLNKSLSIVETVSNVNLLENCSIIKPTFTLNSIALKGSNYLFCEDFNRYYYIDDIEIRTGRLLFLRCSVDVLMSFKDDITSINAVIERAPSNNNVLLNDNVIPTQVDSRTVNKLLTMGEFLPTINATNYSFLLSCYGE